MKNDNKQMLLTLLAAYAAKLIDIEIDGVSSRDHIVSGEETAIINAKITLVQALIQKYHQGIPVLVRKLNDGTYVIIDGFATYMAMRNLGYTLFTAVVITCSDEALPAIVQMCRLNAETYPKELILEMHQSLKMQVKGDLRLAKERGEVDSIHVDATLADVYGTNLTYVKAIDKIARMEDSASYGEKLAAGDSIGSMMSPRSSITPNDKVPRTVEIHSCNDYVKLDDGMCQDCPGRRQFLLKLQERHKIAA